MLRSLDPGLQVSRRVEVLALVPAAATFNVVHADDDRVLAAVHHAGLQGVGVAAVALAPRAVAALKLPTDLQLVCAHVFLRGGAIAHGCQAGGAPGNQQGGAGQQLGHQAHGWTHVAQIRTECHRGTRCQGGRHWECCYGLQLCSRQHELHLLGQHGGGGLLLDQVVPAVNLQLGFQVRRRVQVFTVLPRAAPLERVEAGDDSAVLHVAAPRGMRKLALGVGARAGASLELPAHFQGQPFGVPSHAHADSHPSRSHTRTRTHSEQADGDVSPESERD